MGVQHDDLKSAEHPRMEATVGDDKIGPEGRNGLTILMMRFEQQTDAGDQQLD